MSTPVPRPPAAQRLFADSTVFQWQNQTLRADLIFTLPIAICLAVGLAIHHPGVGLVAAGGAMNTGFGQKHRIDNSQLVPMILVTLGMAFSGFVGVVVGHENLLLVFLSALWAFGYGLLTARPEGYAWVASSASSRFSSLRHFRRRSPRLPRAASCSSRAEWSSLSFHHSCCGSFINSAITSSSLRAMFATNRQRFSPRLLRLRNPSAKGDF